MIRFYPPCFLILLTLVIATGCSGGKANPVVPQSGNTASVNSGNMLWGFYDIVIDPGQSTIEAVPIRGAMFNANVTRFLQPPSAPINLLSIQFNPGSDFASGYLDLNIAIRHPFIGYPKLRGFDVRGIVMGESTGAFSWDSAATHSGPGQVELLNADGWTRWWNPTEFTTYGIIFGYTAGNRATPGYYAGATVNPYKYFSDSLDADTPILNLATASRGTFSVDPGINVRRYLIQFPIQPSGKPLYRFNYAIDASWALPSDDLKPEYPVEVYSPEANMQEAWLVTLDDSASTAWYVNDSLHGGSLSLAIEVFDWQKFNTVQDEVSRIWLESPIISSPLDITPIAVVTPGGPVSSVWNVEITDPVLTGSGEFECWIGVEASHPANYAPQIQGDPNNFAWPNSPLTAYAHATLHVSSVNPNYPPDVIAVDPPSGVVSTVLTSVQIIGSNFLDGATVEFKHESAVLLDVSNVAWVDPNLIMCDLDLSAPLGFYDVTVTNPDMQFDTLDNGFEIYDEFKCEGGAHGWAGNDYAVSGAPPGYLNRQDTAILKQGSHAGMMLYQTSDNTWGLLDPDGGAGQTVQPFMTVPNMYIMDIETCETSGRIAILSLFNPNKLFIYNAEGVSLGDFIPDLNPTNAWITCMDFDKNGDLWMVTKTKIDDDNSDWELRHYSYLDSAPFYKPVPSDTVLINDFAMTGPSSTWGVGDIGISFYLHRLFIFTANTLDGGSNKITSWDLNQSPPAFIKELQNPYPPYTRHHIFNTGALGRMNIDADHRYDNKYEQCRIYAYATIWANSSPPRVDCYAIRLDGDLNILSEGEKWKIPFPSEFDKVPQCAVINDYGPTSSANLVGSHWYSVSFQDWPAPGDW